VVAFSVRLRRLKEDRRVTAKEIAKACGVSPQTVYGWLAGKSPKYKHLASLSEYFGTTTDYLVHGNRSTERIATARELIRIGPKLTDSQLNLLLMMARELVKQT